MGELPPKVVAHEIRKILKQADRMNESMYRSRDSSRLQDTHHLQVTRKFTVQDNRFFATDVETQEGEYVFSVSPEDLANGLLYLQSLPKESLSPLVSTSLRVPTL